ncbi:MAG: WhiB family transcriptional regulator [Nocardioides sp.]
MTTGPARKSSRPATPRRRDRLDQVWAIPGGASAWVRTAWQTQATCATRPDLPWIADPKHLTAWDVEAMTETCAACPVLDECARYVTTAKVRAGWWAGTHRDPAWTPPPRPEWVPVSTGSNRRSRGADAGEVGKRIEQGILPLDGATSGAA